MAMAETQNPLNVMPPLFVSLAYCYFLLAKIPKSILRVIFLLPICYVFSILPWYFSSATLRGVFSYFVTWIASFKLLLFCFQRGPLANPNITFTDFLLLSIIPLKVKEKVTSLPPTVPKPGLSKYVAVWSRSVQRYELVPLFKQPYLATSLQDFWGRRWNLLSSHILRLTIYNPTRETLMGVVGVRPAKVLATMCTIAVSGVMHELMFYYITCGKRPSWNLTCFFVLQGLCMILESIVRKHLCRGKNSIVANTLRVAFVLVTSYWLVFLPVWNNGQQKCNLRYA
ncbi:hypothetical protein L6164_035989 [Bauhinia variegata]|uniref:Uncharacterized protein n=1 Tax=Bauhinia variegata TaxID=167791 RepID=A0ACB9KFQ5_BAUVA|nr:hypothetical protein L6164_035989 [Bauhinia variegata]